MKTKQVLTIEIKQKRQYKKDILINKYAYLLILPAALFVFVFAYLPFAGLVLAFKNYDLLLGIFQSPWVGLDNFKMIFHQPMMLKSIINTITYSSTTILFTFPIPIILAILLNELTNMRLKKVVQTISYVPHFISWISVIGLFYSFLASEGLLNSILGMIFGESYTAKNFLMDSKHFLPILITSSIWKSTGWSSVIFLAAIAGIDGSLYEAAKIDGSNKLRQIWHITLPGIKTTIIVVLVMSLGSLFTSNFEQVYGFQNVYTQDDTEVINTLIYRSGIQNGNYSVATAFGLSQGLVTVITILCVNALSKKVFETSLW